MENKLFKKKAKEFDLSLRKGSSSNENMISTDLGMNKKNDINNLEMEQKNNEKHSESDDDNKSSSEESSEELRDDYI